MFYRIGVLTNFAKFTRIDLCYYLRCYFFSFAIEHLQKTASGTLTNSGSKKKSHPSCCRNSHVAVENFSKKYQTLWSLEPVKSFDFLDKKSGFL